MILTDEQIIEACRKGTLVIEPFDDAQVEPASYDLRVGRQGATASKKELVDIEKSGYLLLEPGDFGIIVTLEEIRLDNQHTGRFGLRSKYTRRGLIASTGPQIDPGFHGRLILSVMNLAPTSIALPYKESIVSVEFHSLEQPTAHAYAGPYQDKLELGAEEIEFITQAESMALPEVINTLSALSRDVAALTASVNVLKWVIPIIVSFGIVIMAAIAAIK